MDLRESRYRVTAVVMIVVAAVLTIAAVGCARNDVTSVRLKWLFTAAFVDHYVAVDQDFFGKSGLRMEIRPGGFELDPIKLVASGTDTFGITGADNLLIAREKGIPIRAVGVVFQRSPAAFLVKKSSGIREISDFRGRRVGVKRGTDVDTVYRALMRISNISQDDVKEIPIRFDMRPFLEDQVEVFPCYRTDELITAEEIGLDLTVITPETHGVQMYGMVYFTTEQTIEQSPRLVKAYMSSVLRGWSWAQENIDEAAVLVTEFNDKLTADRQKRALHEIFLLVGSCPGQMNREGWEVTKATLVAAGVISENANVEPAYDTSFLSDCSR